MHTSYAHRALSLTIVLCSSGCVVNEDCYQGDCPPGLHCIDSRCQVECRSDGDCQKSIFDQGKRCVDNRCRLALAERLKAPELCLEVKNDASGIAGKTRCIADEEGKVVMLFFGLLA